MRFPLSGNVPALVVCTGLIGASASLAATEEERTTVQDLAYGEVLFHFYQDDYFSALTRLLAARQRGEMPNHAEEAELLMGGLYLSYGQHRIAGEVFERLLEQAVDPALHDRAWFFLARIWHQRGYLPEALAALERIGHPLPAELEPDRRMLHAQVLMEQGRFAAALELLDSWPDEDQRWLGYARYNVGVALVRLGQTDAGARALEEVGQIETSGDAGLAALRDQANVALGYAWLQAGAPALAKPSLQRVRLEGPFSSKALLGVGWADAQQRNYRAALAPWIELRGRNLLDSAVQESLLAVPYAYAELGANGQAAEYYANAIVAFEAEALRLDTAIGAIENGEMITDLLDHGAPGDSGWFWRLERVPDTIESRYLYVLMSTHAFQEALKNYRDLELLGIRIEEWSRSLGAFADILDTKQRAFEQRLPFLEQSLARVDVEALGQRRVILEADVERIERNRDIVALGSPAEQRSWRDLEAMEPELELLGEEPDAAELRDKQRFLKGLLIWDLDQTYKERLWHARRDLRDLEARIRAADRSRVRIERERDAWPAQFAEQTARVDALSGRVAALASTTSAGLARQRRYVQDLAIAELRAQRERLATYTLQARFALATIYDRASASAALPPGTEALGTIE